MNPLHCTVRDSHPGAAMTLIFDNPLHYAQIEIRSEESISAANTVQCSTFQGVVGAMILQSAILSVLMTLVTSNSASENQAFVTKPPATKPPGPVQDVSKSSLKQIVSEAMK